MALVLGEAIWLVARGRTRVAAAVACAPIVLAAGALAPLALHQRQEGHLHFIAATSLDSRLSNAAEVFAAGQTGTRVAYVPLIGVGLAAVGLALLMQASVAEHRRLVPLAIVSLSAIALPVILAFVGQDYVLARNLLPVWPALVILVAAGLAATRSRRLGMLIAAALLCFSVCFCIAVPLTPKLRREAINAQLSYVPGENAAVEIAYVPLAAGQTRSSTVDCPGGYRPRAGEVHTVGEPGGGEGLGTVRTRRLAAGWAAIVLNSSPHRATYQLTVVCLPSREVG